MLTFAIKIIFIFIFFFPPERRLSNFRNGILKHLRSSVGVSCHIRFGRRPGVSYTVREDIRLIARSILRTTYITTRRKAGERVSEYKDTEQVINNKNNIGVQSS